MAADLMVPEVPRAIADDGRSGGRRHDHQTTSHTT